MLAAATAKEYANPKFLHALLILWVVAVKIRCRFWCGRVRKPGERLKKERPMSDKGHKTDGHTIEIALIRGSGKVT